MKIVVAGAGDVGVRLAKLCAQQAHDVILVDEDARCLARAEEDLDVRVLTGNCTHRAVLREAEADSADVVFTTSGSDNDNLVAAALSRQMGARYAAARVDDPTFYDTTLAIERDILGVDAILCAARLASHEILRMLRRLELPFVADFAGLAVQAALAPVGLHAPVLGKAPGDLPRIAGCSVMGIVRDDFLRAPQEIPHVDADDQLLIVGPPSGLYEMLSRVGQPSHLRRMVIVGGGNSGMQLASHLSGHGADIQLIELDEARARTLAEANPKVKVLQGDGTSLDLLKDLQVATADVFLSTARDDEINLMAALLARHMGVRHTITLVQRSEFQPIYQQLGIDGVLARSDVLARAMLDVAPTELVQTLSLCGKSEHVLVSLTVPVLAPDQKWDLTSADIALPVHTLLLAHVRGRRLLPPAGRSVLEAGDEIVFAVLPRHLNTLRRGVERLAQGGSR